MTETADIPETLVEFARLVRLPDGRPFDPTPHQVAMLNALDQRAPQRLDLVASRRPGMSTQQYADLALAHAIATGEEVRVISRDKESAAAMTRRAVDILRGLGLDVTPRLQTDREDRTR